MEYSFVKYDELPPEIKEIILQGNPLASQLVSKETKELSDRSLINKYCGVPPTVKEIEDYFTEDNFQSFNSYTCSRRGVENLRSKIYIDGIYYELRHHGTHVYCFLQNNLGVEPAKEEFVGPLTYVEILSKRHLCMSNNSRYAVDEAYRFYNRVINNDDIKYVDLVLIFLLLCMSEVARVDIRHRGMRMYDVATIRNLKNNIMEAIKK